jgi:hypothetical protein
LKPRGRDRDELEPRAQRRALTNVGGQATVRGDPEIAAALAHALDVPSSVAGERGDDGAPSPAEEAARAHVHGFHSYPARMHPLTARRAIEALSRPGELVLDPFCGSGTVLVEARLAGRAAIGVDANPLAIRLATLKARGVSAEERARLVEAARQVAAGADARRKARAGASRRYAHVDVALFAPHVLLELDSLRVGLEELARGPLAGARADLELVLSAILTKVSRKASDSSGDAMARRIAAGYPTKLFVKKAVEVAARLAEVADALLEAPRLDVRLGDARRLESVPRGKVALALTSPPYPGNYDYLAHHMARLRWLDLDPGPLARSEIGARRHLEPLGAEAGQRRFEEDLALTLDAVAGTLAKGGRLAMMMADSVIAGEAVYAASVVQAAAARTWFVVAAVASQPRPHFHAPSQRAFDDGPRAEHLVVLERNPRAPVARDQAKPDDARTPDRAPRRSAHPPDARDRAPQRSAHPPDARSARPPDAQDRAQRGRGMGPLAAPSQNKATAATPAPVPAAPGRAKRKRP